MADSGPRKILVTGGAGFIGSALIRHLIDSSPHKVHVLDALTYAGNLSSLDDCSKNSRYSFSQIDICDRGALAAEFAAFAPDIVMHLAAESHVDRSIDGPSAFIQTNLVGTYNMLSVALDHWNNMADGDKANFRFHHVSTDEVFGSLGATGSFNEETPYSPRSPYSASKAGSDQLVSAWYHTYGLPVLLTNCSNNYGPYHFPEKLIPLTIIKCLKGEKIAVYGDGSNIRDWLYVDDHVSAMLAVVNRGVPGQTYLIGGGAERTNLQVVESLCAILDNIRPRSDGESYKEQIEFVADRPGHDFRYAIDAGKLCRELGWQPEEDFASGLEKTVHWYLNNEKWWQDILSGAYRGERLGLSSAS